VRVAIEPCGKTDFDAFVVTIVIVTTNDRNVVNTTEIATWSLLGSLGDPSDWVSNRKISNMRGNSLLVANEGGDGSIQHVADLPSYSLMSGRAFLRQG
jgi:hypothetical protein